jgi:hypothetical protein
MTLGDFYGAAGPFAGPGSTDSTHAFDLKRVRVVINDHGEYGPVLGVEGQHFLGPDDIATAA